MTDRAAGVRQRRFEGLEGQSPCEWRSPWRRAQEAARYAWQVSAQEGGSLVIVET